MTRLAEELLGMVMVIAIQIPCPADSIVGPGQASLFLLIRW